MCIFLYKSKFVIKCEAKIKREMNDMIYIEEIDCKIKSL